MLNQACLIGHGAAVLCPDKDVPKCDFEMIEEMFKATNGTVDIVLERSMDAFTNGIHFLNHVYQNKTGKSAKRSFATKFLFEPTQRILTDKNNP